MKCPTIFHLLGRGGWTERLIRETLQITTSTKCSTSGEELFRKISDFSEKKNDFYSSFANTERKPPNTGKPESG